MEENSSLLETFCCQQILQIQLPGDCSSAALSGGLVTVPREPLSVGVLHVPLLSPSPPRGEAGTTDLFSGKSFISGREGGFYSCFSDLLQMTFSNHTV